MCTCIGRLACRRGRVYVYVHWVTSLQEREGEFEVRSEVLVDVNKWTCCHGNSWGAGVSGVHVECGHSSWQVKERSLKCQLRACVRGRRGGGEEERRGEEGESQRKRRSVEGRTRGIKRQREGYQMWRMWMNTFVNLELHVILPTAQVTHQELEEV